MILHHFLVEVGGARLDFLTSRHVVEAPDASETKEAVTFDHYLVSTCTPGGWAFGCFSQGKRPTELEFKQNSEQCHD